MSRMVSLPKEPLARLEEIRSILDANSPTPVTRSDAAAYAIDWALLLVLQDAAKGYAPRNQGETVPIIARHRRTIDQRAQAAARAAEVQDAAAPA